MIGGSIHINEHDIVEWSAVNKGRAIHDDTKYMYEVHAKGRDNLGYPFDVEFQVFHNRDKAAVWLTIIILTELNRRVSYV
jgi:hypothetical protein